jgi:hypothetical protein
VFKVRHDCIGRVLFSLKIYNTATTILTIDYSRERERVSERERERESRGREKRGSSPENAKRSIFAVFSPLILYPKERKGKKKHTTNTKRKDAPGNFVRISSTTRRKRKTSSTKTRRRRRRSSRRVWLSV